MRFISNQNKENHKSIISSLMGNADEVYIATAFLKSSGLKDIISLIELLVLTGKKINIIAGQNFALTEPSALHKLRNLFLKKENAKIFLANANSNTKIFHPKFYLFRSADNATILSGSSNITEGGLNHNIECSILIDTTIHSDVYKEAIEFYQMLVAPNNAEEASLMVIKRYETFFEAQKLHNKKAKSIPNFTKAQKDFNYANLIKHFKSFNTKERDELFESKMQHYQNAKEVLDDIADSTKLNTKIFTAKLEDLVGKKGELGWWHSGSLGRLKNSVIPYYKEFAELVRLIRANKHREPSIVFDLASEKVKLIYGADINYVTEIMMTYNGNSFANINKNPITVLTSAFDLNLKKTYRIYNGDDYKIYCDVINEICEKLGLRNMLEADTFFNDIYWKIYKKKPIN